MITTTILTTLATLSAGLIYTHADGGFNMPSSDAIDVAPGLDETLEREDYIKRYPETPDLLSDSEIESLGYPRLEPQPVTGGTSATPCGQAPSGGGGGAWKIS